MMKGKAYLTTNAAFRTKKESHKQLVWTQEKTKDEERLNY